MAKDTERLQKRYDQAVSKMEQARADAKEAKRELDSAIEEDRLTAVLSSQGVPNAEEVVNAVVHLKTIKLEQEQGLVGGAGDGSPIEDED